MAKSGEGWLDETRSAYLYRVMAEIERGSPRSSLFVELAREAEGQAAIWAKNAGLASVPVFVPDLRTRIVAGLLRHFGPRPMRGILVAMKVRGLSVYSHAAPGHPAPTSVEEVGKRHRGIAGGGNLRAEPHPGCGRCFGEQRHHPALRYRGSPGGSVLHGRR